jgi:tRNA threonylcarbamoyladenosine biosynthesis protein TsaE
MPVRAPDSARITTDLIVESTSSEDTFRLAQRLAAVARAGDLICLWGELGAGKTVFAKGFGAGLGVTGTTVASPSFILMAEHAGRLPLFHLDLYRLETARDVLEGGLLDERQADGVTLIEWPDRLGEALPATRLDVRIDLTGETTRRIALDAVGEGHERYVRAAPA